MDILGEKLGPIIFQFPFLSRSIFPDRHAFTDRLVSFLKKLPANHKFGIEIRNRLWPDAEFANLLWDRQIALVLQDRSWMPNPAERDFDPITADRTYIRWLGDRKQIESHTMTWDKVAVDRAAELSSWVDYCYQIMKRESADLRLRPQPRSRPRPFDDCEISGTLDREWFFSSALTHAIKLFGGKSAPF